MTTELLNKESGLVLNNYKEPLKKVAKPYHGYEGAVMVTTDGEKMQCHMCGELFANVAQHSWRAHKIKAKEYKLKFKLMTHTSLCSEKERDRMKIKSMEWWLKMSPAERARMKKKFKRLSRDAKGGRKKGSKNRLEAMNTKGTCPDQIADQIRKCAQEIGHTPSGDDFLKWSGSMRVVGLARYRFGTWVKAVKYAGLTPRGKTKKKGGYTGPRHNRPYSREELLETLSIFYQETGKVPSYTDSKRGLIPDGGIYVRHFGSIRNARKLAGITESVWSGRSNKTPFGNLVKTGYKTNKKI